MSSFSPTSVYFVVKPIYFDYAATTPVDPRVARKMADYLTLDGQFGNPASDHAYGWAAQDAVETAREQVAALINANTNEIIWTSGATEADNLAIKGAAHFYKEKGRHIITCKTEHKAVLDSCKALEHEGFEITYLAPKSNGLVDLEILANSIRPDTILVSIMHVNNEIGVIQDIAAIGEITRQKGIIFHVDAAQSAGKIPIDVAQMNVDLMALASHKVYGPKGIGALYVRNRPRARLMPLIHGGGHEQGLRSGTLATHQIVGMGEAFALVNTEMLIESARLLQMRQRLWNGIKTLGGIYLNGDAEARIAGLLNFSVEGVEGESLLLGLRDLAVSTGSACTSTSIEPSYVLKALGVSNTLAHSTIRLTLGRFTTETEIDVAIEKIRATIQRLRAMSPAHRIGVVS